MISRLTLEKRCGDLAGSVGHVLMERERERKVAKVQDVLRTNKLHHG